MPHQPSPNTGHVAARLKEELQAVWQTATPDSIGPAMVDARLRVASAPPAAQAAVAELMASLEQLERWLRDR